MSRRAQSYKFPYVLVGIAILTSVLYKAPLSGHETPTRSHEGPTSVPRASQLPLTASSSIGTSVETASPQVRAPSGIRTASFERVSRPEVRGSAMVSGTEARPPAARGRDVPLVSDDDVYLPDSLPQSVPSAPIARPEAPTEPVPPLKVRIIRQGPENVNQVALTFDDGPHNTYTPQILDILKQHNIKGTFFVLGEQVSRYPEVLRRVAEEGHEIGNHTFTHPQLKRLNPDQVRQELASTQDEIHKVLGYSPKLLRPPYGAYKDSSLPLFEEMGLHVVLWSVDTYDWKRKGDAIVRTVSKDAKNGSIILFHDRKAETVKVLPQIIDDLLTKGYKMVTISEMTGIPAYDYGTPVARDGSQIVSPSANLVPAGDRGS